MLDTNRGLAWGTRFVHATYQDVSTDVELLQHRQYCLGVVLAVKMRLQKMQEYHVWTGLSHCIPDYGVGDGILPLPEVHVRAGTVAREVVISPERGQAAQFLGAQVPFQPAEA